MGADEAGGAAAMSECPTEIPDHAGTLRSIGAGIRSRAWRRQPRRASRCARSIASLAATWWRRLLRAS